MVSIHNMLGTKEFASAIPISAERELLIATLDRAVLDYYGTSQETKEEAEEWLFGESDSSIAFSFTWICEHLKLEPAALRRRIQALDIPAGVSQAHRWLRNKVQSKDGLLEKTAYHHLAHAA